MSSDSTPQYHGKFDPEYFRSQLQSNLMRSDIATPRDVETLFKIKNSEEATHKYNFDVLDIPALRSCFQDEKATAKAKEAAFTALVNKAFTNSKMFEGRMALRNDWGTVEDAQKEVGPDRSVRILHLCKKKGWVYEYPDSNSKVQSVHDASEDYTSVGEPVTFLHPLSASPVAKDIVESACETLYQDKLSPKMIERWSHEGRKSLRGPVSNEHWDKAVSDCRHLFERDHRVPRDDQSIPLFNTVFKEPEPNLWEKVKEGIPRGCSDISSRCSNIASDIKSKFPKPWSSKFSSSSNNQSEDDLPTYDKIYPDQGSVFEDWGDSKCPSSSNGEVPSESSRRKSRSFRPSKIFSSCFGGSRESKRSTRNQ